MKTFLTIKHAAEKVGLCADHLRRLANAGQVKTMRASDGTRLFTVKDLDRFAESRSRKSRGTRSARENRGQRL